MPDKPNLLLVFADQMRAEAMGCMGNAQVHTPHLDRLAAQGALFTNAIANHPLCTPSRASLLTGRYPLSCRTVTNDLQMPTDQVTFAHVLGRAGYRCGYVGKWHLDGWPRNQFTPPGPRRQGFDDYWAVHNCTHDYFHPHYYLNDDPNLVEVPGYEPEVQTDLAIGCLERWKDEPFCLVVSWGPPHNPYEMVPERYRKQYDPEALVLRPNCGQDANRRNVADYYAAVTALDENLGRLLAALDRLGIAGRTLVVFTSDHGDLLWSHHLTDKQAPWEEAIHIPLVMRLPGTIPAGRKSEELIGIADLAPTMLGLLGARVPREMEGLDFTWAALGQAGSGHTSVPIMDLVPTDNALRWNIHPWRGVRTRRYTYARRQGQPWVLYDNREDPYQLKNLAEEASAAPLRREMEGELQSWLERLGDRFGTAEECLASLGQTEAWAKRQEHFHKGGNW